MDLGWRLAGWRCGLGLGGFLDGSRMRLGVSAYCDLILRPHLSFAVHSRAISCSYWEGGLMDHAFLFGLLSN